MKRSILSTLFVFTLIFTASTVNASIELDTKNVVIGKDVTVHVTRENNEPLRSKLLEVTYYPNSEIKRVVEVGRTDPFGRVRWRPDYAGLATLAVNGQSTTVGVRFDGMPLGALIVFLVAGTLLFGGLAFGVSRLR